MAKSPAFQFYPGDWLRNDVSGCSLEAQGLWLRMIMVMHDAQIYGQLVLNNEPMSPEFVAKKIGITPKKYANLLKELDFAGVINRKENGVIFSGRMERDEVARQQNRERQAKHRDESNAPVTDKVTDMSRDGHGKSNGDVTALSQPSSLFPLRFPLQSSDLKRLIERAVAENSKIDPRIVEIGVIHTLLQRNGSQAPINSAMYFDQEIQKVNQGALGLTAGGKPGKDLSPMTPRAIDTMLKSRRQQMERKLLTHDSQN